LAGGVSPIDDAQAGVRQVEALLASGDLPAAATLCRQLLRAFPRDFMLLVRAAQVAEMDERIEDAIVFYERAIAANSGFGFTFTRRAQLRFRSRFGMPPKPRAAPPGPRIGMSSLGLNGRFGNQLLQYGVLRLYAQEHGLAAETPDWIGRDLFDLDDPLQQGPLAPMDETTFDIVGSLMHEGNAVLRDTDLSGYFCGPTGRWARHHDAFRGFFKPGHRVGPLLGPAHERLRARGDTLIVVHLRRGDFGYGQFWIAPTAWYARWLDSIWGNLRRPVLYVATDDARTVGELSRFAPLTAAELGVEIPGAEFLADFQVMRDADLLAVSNSSFSFVAAMLNTRAQDFLRPQREAEGLVPFDPWNAPVLI
jgi:hypothetical protein